jgi:hypothetical protein
MRPEPSPYVSRCTRCENGLLRLYRCAHCQTVAAVCDECELLWTDIPSVSHDPNCPSDASFPACPQCGTVRSTWTRLDGDQIQDAQLDAYLSGRSS